MKIHSDLIEILFEEVASGAHNLIEDLGYFNFCINEKETLTQQSRLMPVHPNCNYLLCTKEIAKYLQPLG